MIIQRRVAPEVAARLEQMPAVAVIGPRQAGKTTLAHSIAAGRKAVYLDLESVADRARPAEPALYLADHAVELVVLDEIHRVPGLFEELRGVIDQGRREGKGTDPRRDPAATVDHVRAPSGRSAERRAARA